jgi:CO dehydrogenase maturation factor
MKNRDRNALSGRRIGIFGKGGCGKSTATVLLATALRRRGYGVCVLDADSTNLGLERSLGIDKPPAPLLDYFGGMVFSGGRVTCPVDDPTPLPGAEVTLEQLPEPCVARSPDGVVFLVAGKMGGLGPGAGCDGPIAKIARDLRVRDDGGDLVTLVDFKAGFEDSARGVITGLDWAVVIVDPTRAAVEMAVHLRDLVREIRAGGLPATRHLESDLVRIANRAYRESGIRDALVVLNRVRHEGIGAYLLESLAARGIEPIGTLHEDLAIPAASLKGAPLEARRAARDAEQILDRLLEIVAASAVPRRSEVATGQGVC